MQAHAACLPRSHTAEYEDPAAPATSDRGFPLSDSYLQVIRSLCCTAICLATAFLPAPLPRNSRSLCAGKTDSHWYVCYPNKHDSILRQSFFQALHYVINVADNVWEGFSCPLVVCWSRFRHNKIFRASRQFCCSEVQL